MEASSRPSGQQIPPGVYALLLAMFASGFAVIGQITIIGKQVFDMTGSTLDLGLLGLAEFLPVAILSPITGSVADRFDRRKVFAGSLVGEIAVSLLLFLYVRSDPTSVLPIFGLVVLFGVFRASSAPASRALPIDLSPPALLERIVALRTFSFMGGAIAGPVVMGFVFVGGASLPYLVAAAGFCLAILLLALVPRPPIQQHRPTGARQVVRDAFDGLRFIRGNPIVFGAISLDLFAVLFGGVIVLLPAIAEERLGVGAVGLGWLRAAVGIGAASTALTLAIRPLRRHLGRRLLTMVALFGVMTILLGFTRNFAVAFVLLLIAAAADSVSMFVRAGLVPIATPAEMRGRVLAVENVFIGASNELGAVESGVTATLFGLVGAIVFGGVGTLVVVALWWRIFPALRSIDRFADVRPDAPPPDST